MIKLKRFFKFYWALICLVLIIQLFLLAVMRTASFDSDFHAKFPSPNFPFVDFASAQHSLVFLHIQKTSGTNFDTDLVNNLLVTETDRRTGKEVSRKACSPKDIFLKNEYGVILEIFYYRGTPYLAGAVACTHGSAT
jgi:hypothetical protein